MRLRGEVHMILLDLSRKLSKRGSKYIHPLTIKGYKFTDLIAKVKNLLKILQGAMSPDIGTISKLQPNPDSGIRTNSCNKIPQNLQRHTASRRILKLISKNASHIMKILVLIKCKC